MNEKMVDRVRKLLELSHSSNEHEAAQAAARAAQLMSEHAITEAMLQVVSESDAAQAETRAREGIVEHGLPDAPERKVAWRDRIASAVATSLDCKALYWNNQLQAIGRESAVQTWVYTSQYLFAEVTRLADEAWLVDGADLAAVGERPSTWKGAFRLGAADVIANRLHLQYKERLQVEQTKARELAAAPDLQLPAESGGTADVNNQRALARVDAALAIVARDRAEVENAFKKRTEGPGWRKTRGLGQSTRRRSGYQTGRFAGAGVSLDQPGRRLKP